MDEATLRRMIAEGETAVVEFKSSAARPIDIAQRMCGMANNRSGGLIIFGIEDATRAIIGIRNPSLTNDVVLRAARMVKPPISLDETSVQTWVLDGHTLVTVNVPPNTGRLYQYDGACYVRRGTHTVPLSVEEINAFLNRIDFMVTFRNGQVVEQSSDLNPRQVIGVKIARERGSISTPEYCVAIGATERMGLRDLQDLVAKGLLIARGKKERTAVLLAVTYHKESTWIIDMHVDYPCRLPPQRRCARGRQRTAGCA